MRKLVNLDRSSSEEAQLTPRRARHVLTEPVPKYGDRADLDLEHHPINKAPHRGPSGQLVREPTCVGPREQAAMTA